MGNNRISMVFLGVAIGAASMALALGIEGPPSTYGGAVSKDQFDECIAGWKKSIADLNAFTDSLNNIYKRH